MEIEGASGGARGGREGARGGGPNEGLWVGPNEASPIT